MAQSDGTKRDATPEKPEIDLPASFGRHLSTAPKTEISKLLELLIELHEQLEELRDEAIETRLKLRDDKSKLRKERGKANDEHAQLITCFRELRKSFNSASLDQLFEKTLEARDKYSELLVKYDEDEDEYDLIEDLQDTKQWELRRSEHQFIERVHDLVARLSPLEEASNKTLHYSREHNAQRSESVPHRRADDDSVGPRHQYLVLLGKQNEWNGVISELLGEKAAIIEHERFREAENLPMSEQYQELLSTFPYDFENATKNLRQVQKEMEELRPMVLHVAPNPNYRRESVMDNFQEIQKLKSASYSPRISRLHPSKQDLSPQLANTEAWKSPGRRVSLSNLKTPWTTKDASVLPAVTSLPQASQDFGDLLHQMRDLEPSAALPKDEDKNWILDNEIETTLVNSTGPTQYSKLPALSASAYQTNQEEQSVRHRSSLWYELEQNRQLVNKWIWDMLRESRWERFQLTHEISGLGVGDASNSLWNRVKAFWNRDVDLKSKVEQYEKLRRDFVLSDPTLHPGPLSIIRTEELEQGWIDVQLEQPISRSTVRPRSHSGRLESSENHFPSFVMEFRRRRRSSNDAKKPIHVQNWSSRPQAFGSGVQISGTPLQSAAATQDRSFRVAAQIEPPN